MNGLSLARLGAVSAAVFASLAVAASAATGPPPPTSTNGHVVQLVASGLNTPTSFAFGGGSIFEGDAGSESSSAPPNGGVFLLKGGTATKVPSALLFVSGLAWHKNALYAAGGMLGSKGVAWVVQRWTGWNGSTFAHQRTIFTGPGKFDGTNGIGFGANGRLYLGVDLGLTDGNDHGPATTSPHVYQILSMRANGKNVRVFARGIRQPWQMAFPTGSNSPYVTDLGQDSGAKNPPDFILRVHAGDNYGFPKCNHTKATAKVCRHYAKPWKRFPPHFDPMGIVLKGKTLFVTSFLGPKGKGPGGEVFTLKTNGTHLRPLIKGFVAPIVGLGRSGHWLYVGELTGQVFRVRI